MIQSDDAPGQITWTHEEEIALDKGWVDVFENSRFGNPRKETGFWCEVLAYMESKTKQYARRTYDMMCGKWKTVCPVVVRFCGVYGNVMRMSQKSRASDEDYVKRALMHYQAKTRNTFKYRHCWEAATLKMRCRKFDDQWAGTKREMLQKIKGREHRDIQKEQREAFLEIKRKEVECCEREIAAQEYRQRQEDIRFYLQPYNHLTGEERMEMETLRVEIKVHSKGRNRLQQQKMNDLVYVMYNLKLSGREERKRKEEDFETFNFEDVDSDDEWITKDNEDLTNVYENEPTTHGDSRDDDFLEEAIRNQYGGNGQFRRGK
ncbi:hypothetical protein Tco_0678752 [Tanacetum coccineum]|uniref:Myb-like domain-containing protein n=1 Tax=Tanacetum coccineum TaxID=301880 RepID=A0ABQ4XGX7_9ASTR